MSGTYTFLEFKNRLKFEAGMRDDVDSEYTDISYGDWINTAYTNLTTRADLYFPELETSSTDSTADGTEHLDTPSDALIVRTLWESTSDIKMKAIAWNDYVDSEGRSSSSDRGAPTEWVRRGLYLYLLPTPDAVYGVTIYYRKKVPDLVADNAVTIIGREWDEPILKLAVIQSLMRLKRYEEAAIEKKEYNEQIQNLKDLYFQEHIDREDIRRPDYTWLKNEY